MNFKKYHVSKNLFDESTLLNGYYGNTSPYQYFPNDSYRCFSMSLSAGTYTILAKSDSLTISLLRVSSASLGTNTVNLDNQSYTFTLSASETIYVSLRNSTTTDDFTGLTIMLNVGETPEPYEPYSSEVWHDIPHYIHNTSTDTITTLPADIHPTGTTATVGLKGNTLQSSIPSPTSPVMPQECGERTGNLFDKSTALLNYYINDGNGAVSKSTEYNTSASMPIEVEGLDYIYPSTNGYTGTRQWAAFYDGSGNYISGFNGYNIAKAVPSNAKTVRFTVHSSYIDAFSVNAGSTTLPYEPYGYFIEIEVS